MAVALRRMRGGWCAACRSIDPSPNGGELSSPWQPLRFIERDREDERRRRKMKEGGDRAADAGCIPTSSRDPCTAKTMTKCKYKEKMYGKRCREKNEDKGKGAGESSRLGPRLNQKQKRVRVNNKKKGYVLLLPLFIGLLNFTSFVCCCFLLCALSFFKDGVFPTCNRAFVSANGRFVLALERYTLPLLCHCCLDCVFVFSFSFSLLQSAPSFPLLSRVCSCETREAFPSLTPRACFFFP